MCCFIRIVIHILGFAEHKVRVTCSRYFSFQIAILNYFCALTAEVTTLYRPSQQRTMVDLPAGEIHRGGMYSAYVCM